MRGSPLVCGLHRQRRSAHGLKRCCSRRVASVSVAERETPAVDEDQGSADARSAPTSLLLPPKGSRATGAIEFHARQHPGAARGESAPLREKEARVELRTRRLRLVSMKEGWLSSAVGVPAVRGRGRSGGGEQRSSLYRLFNVGDRAKWEARSGGAFPKRAVRRLDETRRLPERRAGCG